MSKFKNVQGHSHMPPIYARLGMHRLEGGLMQYHYENYGRYEPSPNHERYMENDFKIIKEADEILEKFKKLKAESQ